MIGIWLCALLIIAASLVVGRAAMTLAGWRRPSWIAGAVGFAVLCVVAPLAIRLPGRGLTAAIVLLALCIAAAVVVHRSMPARGEGSYGDEHAGGRGPSRPHLVAAIVALVMLLLASLPFLINERVGILGEGIYTNDHAVQLYWTDWLARGFGVEPNAVSFGYPTGPQSIAAALSRGTGLDLITTFNGLLLAIPVLTAVAALAGLGRLGAWRRGIAALLVGMSYLGASFLAQSSFKETAMGLLVLAFAIALTTWRAQGVRGRSLATIIAILAAASVFTFSIPGLAWFGLGLILWLAAELISGSLRIDTGAIRAAISRHRKLVIGGTVAVLVVLGLAAIPAIDFIGKIDNVTASSGRLSSPVFPGEALGIWPNGDFRDVRGEVQGSLLATGFAALCMLAALVAMWRRREWGLLGPLIACGVIYAVARPVAEIHVEAKALVIAAPLAMLVVLRFLLADAEGSGKGRAVKDDGDSDNGAGHTTWDLVRWGAGAVFALAAFASVVLALRAAPVGFDDRGRDLEQLAEQVDGDSVVFLGVDRFAGYWLREARTQSPGGYVANDVRARSEKVWQQGDPLDLDTLDPRRLDHFDYAITTSAAYQSSPPPNLTEVARQGDYVLWRIDGRTPGSSLIESNGEPGAVLDCSQFDLDESAGAVVWTEPIVGGWQGWSPGTPLDAPASTGRKLGVAAGNWDVSIQYASQVPLTVTIGGQEVATLPPSLEGMYLTSPGRGAFWAAGTVTIGATDLDPVPPGLADQASEDGVEGLVEVTVTASEPSRLQRAIGSERKFWLGAIALTDADSGPESVPIAEACGDYVDRITGSVPE